MSLHANLVETAVKDSESPQLYRLTDTDIFQLGVSLYVHSSKEM